MRAEVVKDGGFVRWVMLFSSTMTQLSELLAWIE